VSDFAEIREKRVCVIDSAVNQHSLVWVEVCDQFWPYEKDGSAVRIGLEAHFGSQVRSLLEARACVKCTFGPSDQKFAADLYARGIPMEQIDRAITLGCYRKYLGLLNGTDNQPIFRLSYFRDLIQEAGETDPGYWRDIVYPTLKKYESKWLKAN
jgi:hypothetical protein